MRSARKVTYNHFCCHGGKYNNFGLFIEHQTERKNEEIRRRFNWKKGWEKKSLIIFIKNSIWTEFVSIFIGEKLKSRSESWHLGVISFTVHISPWKFIRWKFCQTVLCPQLCPQSYVLSYILSPMSSVLCPQSYVLSPISSVLCPQSYVLTPLPYIPHFLPDRLLF